MARQFKNVNVAADETKATFAPLVRKSAGEVTIVIEAPFGNIYLDEREAFSVGEALLREVAPAGADNITVKVSGTRTGRLSSGGLEPAPAERYVPVEWPSTEADANVKAAVDRLSKSLAFSAMYGAAPERLHQAVITQRMTERVSPQVLAHVQEELDAMLDRTNYVYTEPPVEEQIARIRDEADLAFDAAMGGPALRAATDERLARLAEVDRLEALAAELERQRVAAEDPGWA